MEQGLLVVLDGKDSREGAEIFLDQEWLWQPWADRVTLSVVMGCRKPILLLPWCSRIDWNMGISDAMISAAENHANIVLDKVLNKNNNPGKLK